MGRKFLGKVFILLKGASLGQLILLIASPILTRIYSAEQFGSLAVYISILSILVVNASYRLEITILQPKSNKKALEITMFCLYLLIINLFSLILFFIFFTDFVIEYLNIKLSTIYFLLIPIGFFGIGLNQILSNYALRKEEYSILSKTKINQNVGMAASQVLLGLLGMTVNGLLYGDVVGRISGNLSLISLTTKDMKFFKPKLSYIRIKRYLLTNYKYPVISSLSNLLNNLSMQSPSIILAINFNSYIVGYYSIVMRIFEAPISMLGKSVGQVYMKELLSNKNKNEKKKITNNLLKRMSQLALLLLFCLYYIIPNFVEVIFGSGWEKTGEYIKILSILLALELVASPFLQILDLLKKQLIYLFWQLIRVFFVLAVLLVVPIYIENDLIVITLYSLSMAFAYLILILIVYNIINKDMKNEQIETD